MKDFSHLPLKCLGQNVTCNRKLPAAFSLNCYHYLPTEWGYFLKDFFIQCFAVIRGGQKKRKTAKITHLFSQEGKITFKTLRIRAAPTTPTTMTSIKLKKMGKDRNQNLHNPFLKSSTH